MLIKYYIIVLFHLWNLNILFSLDQDEKTTKKTDNKGVWHFYVVMGFPVAVTKPRPMSFVVH